MFGLNDNGTQQSDNTAAAPASDPAAMPANPFGDAAPATQPAVTPSVHPEPVSEPDPVLPSQPELPTVSHPVASTSGSSDLLGLKEQALHNLQPLVSHLDQTPEEKFKTTMMLIQATDNSALVKEAYEAANQITDEKVRAQALLDVVNEINYFTQHNGPADEKA